MEFAFLSRPRKDEQVCGDGVGVFGREGDRLFAVADGLGHGPEAQDATQKALGYLGERWEAGLESLLLGCNEAVRNTRGLALFVCRVTEGSEHVLECSGVGNVDLKSAGPTRITPFPRDGVVGRGAFKTSVFRFDCVPGDLVAIYTDGISSKFDLAALKHLPAPRIAQSILEGHGRESDDATVLVVRLGGAQR